MASNDARVLRGRWAPFGRTTRGDNIGAVDAASVARAAVEAIAPGSPGLTLVGPAPDAGPVVSRADARRLAQIVRNLLQNAVTHTPPPDGRIEVGVEARGEQVIVAVSDTGRGIPAEHLPLVWDRFHRVDPSRDRASGGMGLGLALVRQLVVAMGGTVGVESELGRGSRFWVSLPRG